ncbi:MAG: hypothetical protein ABSE59_11195, partial [Opitutaceae bacterium]
NTGPVAHQMLLTLDYSGEVDRYQNLRMDPGIASEKNSTGGWVNPVSQLDPNNPNWNFVTFQQNPNLYDQVQENYWDAVNDYGLFLNEHASMFNKRLNVIAGLRFDWLNTKLDDYSVINYPLGTLYEKDFDANTNGFPSHQLGISYRIVKPVTLYINQSTSLNPQPSYNPGTATLLPNSTSTGYEAGAKVDLFKNKLSFTSTYYSINQYNLLYQTTTDITLANGVNETGVDSYVDVLKGHSTGAEFDLSYNPTRSLQVLLDYSYDDASIRQADAQHLFLNGDPIRRVPANQFGSAVHYQFNNGPLKGLFLLCDENFVGRSSVNISGGLIATGTGFVNNPLPNGIFPWSPFGVAPYAPVPPNLTNRLTPIALVNANGLPNTADPYIVRLPDGRESIYNSAYWLTNIGVGYNFKTGKYSHRVQVNVKNLFNRAYTYGSAILGDPITYVCSYTLTF